VREKKEMMGLNAGESFVQVYRNVRQEILFDGQMQAFAYFGGVFPVIVYGKMKTVVKKLLKGKGRIEQEAFHQFRSYYTFQSKFCNVASGNEKGGVEGLVKFSRRWLLSSSSGPVPTFLGMFQKRANPKFNMASY